MKTLVRVLIGTLATIAVAGCASSSITRTAQNRAVISTNAAPICRTSGAASVAEQTAAIATLKNGYQRFVIVGFGTANNTSVVATGPTYATTSGTYSSFGSTTYGTSKTHFGGQTTFVTGSNDAQAEVVMLNPGDPGFDHALDARSTLGPEWQKKVENGINTCFD